MKDANCGEAKVTGFSFAGFWIDIEKVKAHLSDPKHNTDIGVTYTTKYQFVDDKLLDTD